MLREGLRGKSSGGEGGGVHLLSFGHPLISIHVASLSKTFAPPFLSSCLAQAPGSDPGDCGDR